MTGLMILCNWTYDPELGPIRIVVLKILILTDLLDTRCCMRACLSLSSSVELKGLISDFGLCAVRPPSWGVAPTRVAPVGHLVLN